MKDIRVGIIGAGWATRNRHLPALGMIPDVRVVLLWSRNSSKAKKVAKDFGIRKIANRWQEIIEATNVEAVIVTTPPILHSKASIAALEVGKHVLCQGRMAPNLKEAHQMVHAAESTDLVAALYPPRPGIKGDFVMKRLLHKDSFVGEIRDVHLISMSTIDRKEGYDWRTNPDVMGINTMALGMWAEVLNRWIGPVKQVTAVGESYAKSREAENGDIVEPVVPDSLSLSGKLSCGGTLSYHLSQWALQVPRHLVEIYGTEGTLTYRFFKEEIKGASSDDDELQRIEISPGEERLHNTDAEFIQAIKKGTQVSPDFMEGLRYMDFCEAVALSIKTGGVVEVPPTPGQVDSWKDIKK